MKGFDVKSIVQVLGNICGDSWLIVLRLTLNQRAQRFLCPAPLGRNQSQLKRVPVTLSFLSYLSSSSPLKGGESVHLETTPQALVFLLTTRGSLTYIGSYISGAKSTLENSQVSSGTWAMSWMFGHEGKEGVGWLPSGCFPSLAPNENGHSTPSCCSAAGPLQVMSKRTTKSWILEACSIFTFTANAGLAIRFV